MNIVGVIGVSTLGANTLVVDLIDALRIEGWSVSTIKRAPDGFDLDRPGKASYARREAGCRDVVLVGDRRLVLMHEFGDGGEPSLPDLLARLVPVDVVIAEGFKSAAIPTVEVCAPSSGRECRWKTHPNIVALVSDEDIDAPMRRFKVSEVAGLAEYLGVLLGLPRRC
jgi:molybdopterin-guanine dinucleotide biosynthesis protein B